MKAEVQETEMEIALTARRGSWRGLEASIKADAAIGEASKRVINVLRLVRPALTLLLWLITGWIFAKTQDGSIVEAAVFAATAATLWWFGERASKPTQPGGPRVRDIPNMSNAVRIMNIVKK